LRYDYFQLREAFMKRICFMSALLVTSLLPLGAQPPIEPGEYAPAPWKRVSIGENTVPGKIYLRRSVFTIEGAGSDIWAAADSFEFVAQQLRGDGALIARVQSMDNTDEWAKTGVMLREDFTPGARNAAVILNPEKGVWLQMRTGLGKETEELFGVQLRAPVWLGIERRGDTLKGFFSRDGKEWRRIGTTSIPNLKERVQIGLCVNSRVKDKHNRSVFEGVELLPKIPIAP
jgi:hypothetical protein